MAAPTPANQAERLQALQRYDILDTDTEREFDDITALIANICKAPIAVINLIADERQWFKSEVGLGVRQTPLDVSICAHAVLQNDFLEVSDTTEDERFACNPLVTGPPGLRFYAGAILRTPDGYPIGTLCVLDTVSRVLEPQQREALVILAEHVMSLLELRLAMRRQTQLTGEVQQLLAERRRVGAMVSHDLRAPLSVVMLTAEQLHDTASSEHAKRLAERLQRACRAMIGLVDDLIDEESLEKGEVALDLQPHRPRSLLQEAYELFAPLADRAGVRLVLAVDPSLPAVRCDGTRILQVLQNFLGNAIKFTPRGGVVTLGARGASEAVAVFVTDTGPGIAQEQHPLVFRPFYRVPDHAVEGTGLGLAIARRLVEEHGARIEIASSLGAGATFSFELPLAR